MVSHVLSNHFRNTRGMQYISVFIASLAVTSTQMYASWPSPSIPLLKGDDSPLDKPVTGEQASWIVAVMLLGATPAALTYHLTAARFGRKQIIHVASVTLFLPWFLIIFGNHIAYIYVARILGGVLFAIIIITSVMYSAEISDTDIRGRLGTIFGIMKLIGAVIVFAIGPFVSYTVLAIVCGIFPFALFCLLFFIPESPHSLAKKNRLVELRESVVILSGESDEAKIDERIKTIVAFVNSKAKPMGFKELVTTKKYIRPIIAIVLLEIFGYLGGYDVLVAYQQDIIAESESGISPEISSIIFGLVQIPTAVLSAFLVDRIGRKIILYIGIISSCVPLIAEGVYFYVEDYLKKDVSDISWLPTTGLIIYLICHSIYATVPNILLGELFPDRMKDVATTIFATVGVLSVFVATKSFEPLRDAFGVFTCFWIFAIFTAAMIPVAYFFLIETKNKSFEQIEQEMYH